MGRSIGYSVLTLRCAGNRKNKKTLENSMRTRTYNVGLCEFRNCQQLNGRSSKCAGARNLSRFLTEAVYDIVIRRRPRSNVCERGDGLNNPALL